MKIKLLLSLLTIPFFLHAQEVVKPERKPLVVIKSLDQYKKSVKENPNNQLVEIKKAIPNIALDIKYATTDNFMKEVMYKQARAFGRKPVVDALKKVQEELNQQGLGLKIHDGYRPYEITVAFYKKASDKNFVANPKFGSKHNRGCAIDLTLIDLKTGKELEMPTPYDSFERAAAANYEDVTAEAKKNRTLLIEVMGKYNLKVLHNEWWHYDFIGWEGYDIMDIPFEKL
jgi:D-alanyl-D-alanine dipeptidase